MNNCLQTYIIGEFYSRPKETIPVRGDRSPVKIPKDNLTVSGDFYSPKRDLTVPKGERYDVKKHADHLKMEGKMDFTDHKTTVSKGERATIIRRGDNLTVGEGSMQLETTQKASQRSMTDTRISKSTSQGVVRNQTTSQIVLGDDIGDARFEKVTTAKRTTMENRNLENGHMTVDQTLESRTSQGAETRTSADHSVQQKILSQSMSAKSSVNQSMVLNDVQRQAALSSQLTSSQTHESGAISQTTQRSSQSSTAQLHANQTGSKEVQVTREVTVTKRAAPGGGEIITTTTKSSSRGSPVRQTVTSSTAIEESSRKQDMSSSSYSQKRHVSSQSSNQQQSSGFNFSNTQQNQNRSSDQQSMSQQAKSTSQAMAESKSSNIQQNTSTSTSKQVLDSSITLASQSQVANFGQTDRNASSIGDGPAAGGSSSKNETNASNTFAASLRSSSGNITSQARGQSQSRSQIFQGETESLDRRFSSSASAYGSHNNNMSSDCAVHSHNQSQQQQQHSGGLVRSSGVAGATNRSAMSSSQADSQRYSYSHNQNQQSQQQQKQHQISMTQSSSTIGYSSGSRAQKIVRSDNLSVGQGAFGGQTSSKSYGLSQVRERVVPVRSTQQSSISLGSYAQEAGGSSYRKEFKRQTIQPCPASLIQTTKSPFKLERQTSSHTFYMPKVSD